MQTQITVYSLVQLHPTTEPRLCKLPDLALRLQLVHLACLEWLLPNPYAQHSGHITLLGPPVSPCSWTPWCVNNSVPC